MYTDFILDITNIPGSSDDVTLQAIKYYSDKLNEPNLPEELKDIARAFVGNLSQFYEMSNLNSRSLREALPHLSETAQFMATQNSSDVDIESTGRIKSLFSVYQKILDKTIECIEKDIPIPQNGLLKDIYATRDILYPRYDMKLHPEAFYKLTYKIVLEYMKYIDNLSKHDNRYGFVVMPEIPHRNLSRPKKYTYPKNTTTIAIPEKDFIDYSLENEGIQHGFRHLADLTSIVSSLTLATETVAIKNGDISNKEWLSTLIIYNELLKQTQKDLQYKLRNIFEGILIDKLDSSILKDYYALPMENFLDKYKLNLNGFEEDACQLIHYINSQQNSAHTSELTELPTFTNVEFAKKLTKTLEELSIEQDEIMNQKLKEIHDLDTSDFLSKLTEACKIKHYSYCCKDYMKNPKATGYQSIHIRTRTPFGSYEKQIRTSNQHEFAERGHASHTLTYKPDIKTTFHRLKVVTPFSPKRDENGDIITPIELGVLPFEAAVKAYYGVPFSNFADGKTFEEFKSQFTSKEEFDKALFDLSPKDDNFISKLKNKFFKKTNKKLQTSEETISQPIFNSVPQDIAVYASVPSTDDSDPHDNR